MSSNTQVHVEPMVAASVGGSSTVSVAELIAGRGAAEIARILEHLPVVLSRFPVAERERFQWTPAGERAWRTALNGDVVTLSLSGAVAELKVSGTRWVPEGTDPHLELGVMAKAEKRVNELWALTVAVGISERLTRYVEQKAGSKVTQEVRVTPVRTKQHRTAVRATSAVRLKVR